MARQIEVALSIVIRIRQNRIWSRFIWKMWPTLSVHVCTFWVFYDTRLLSSGPSVPQVWDDVWVLQKSQIYDAQFEMWKSSLKLPKSVDMHKIIMYFTKKVGSITKSRKKLNMRYTSWKCDKTWNNDVLSQVLMSVSININTIKILWT